MPWRSSPSTIASPPVMRAIAACPPPFRDATLACRRVPGKTCAVSRPLLTHNAERRSPRRMSYAVKEIFYTLQGEGAQAGRPAVFCRFAGCNLWSGREEDRASAEGRFCDTEFVGTDGDGGGKFGDAE